MLHVQLTCMYICTFSWHVCNVDGTCVDVGMLIVTNLDTTACLSFVVYIEILTHTNQEEFDLHTRDTSAEYSSVCSHYETICTLSLQVNSGDALSQLISMNSHRPPARRGSCRPANMNTLLAQLAGNYHDYTPQNASGLLPLGRTSNTSIWDDIRESQLNMQSIRQLYYIAMCISQYYCLIFVINYTS